MQKKHAPVHAPVQNYDNDDDDGDDDDDDMQCCTLSPVISLELLNSAGLY